MECGQAGPSGALENLSISDMYNGSRRFSGTERAVAEVGLVNQPYPISLYQDRTFPPRATPKRYIPTRGLYHSLFQTPCSPHLRTRPQRKAIL
jgi:hypothetical protein